MLRIRHKHNVISYLTILLVLFVVLPQMTFSQDFSRLVNLEGYWKFSIGDNASWSDPDYDDSHWESIIVPKSWEEQGFHGYDGYAWYRTKVLLPENHGNASLYLKLGYIDDVDKVYINGWKIGQTGMFPPQYTTAHNANRIYAIPSKMMCDDGYITIAVKVFDEGGEGGILHGDIAIMIDQSSIIPDFDLQGEWKFTTGDCKGNPADNDYNTWDNIIVPGTWEDQGYKDYDGVACYVVEFSLEDEFLDQLTVLLLGRIDDLDMVYLNGILIGQSGDFNEETVNSRADMYKQLRGYYIPEGILTNNGKNVLAVKVFDLSGFGGIWDGSVGIISQENYIKYWKVKRNSIR